MLQDIRENYMMRSFIICTLHQIPICRMIKLRRMGWMGHAASMGVEE
jgi:hypothetical protein